MLEHRTRTKVAQLGLDESAQVARRAVFDAEYRVQIIVVLDDHAGTQLGGRDRHCLKQSPSNKRGLLSRRMAGMPHFPPHKGRKVILHSRWRKGNLPKAALIVTEPHSLQLR